VRHTLSDDDRRFVQQTLLRRRAVLEQRLAQRERSLHSDTLGEVHDRGDEAVRDLDSELKLAATERSAVDYEEVLGALARLGEGTYGLCVDCKDGIDIARLRATPTVTRCLACQTQHEVDQDERDATPSL